MTTTTELTYQQRIDALRATKMKHTQEKWQVIGSMDMDDLNFILPPPESRKIVQVISGSGIPITDVLLNEFEPIPNHPNGGFYGARSCGENFRRLLELHPTYIDPVSSMAGAYMVNFLSYRNPFWSPEIPFTHLAEVHEKYKLSHGIGAVQHFCQDLKIGFDLGWGGIWDKIQHYKKINLDEEAVEFYAGLENIIKGIQNWIGRHAIAAREMAEKESNPQLRQNLLEMAEMNERLVTQPPQTFREAVQWMLWFQCTAKMYNMSGSLGRMDVVLYPYYQRDKAAGILTDEEAIFYLACHFVQDTSYSQVGGPDETGKDVTNPLSFLILEAAKSLKIPANVGVSVGDKVDPRLLKRGVEIIFENRTGFPKFLGVENTSKGFSKNGYPVELGYTRAYSGCNWIAIPGREYCINDCVKINLARVFEVAFQDMMANQSVPASTERLWERFEYHLREGILGIAKSIDFHLNHMHEVFPELVIDMLCHGPIEKGRDASHGGVEFYDMCLDAAGFATVADSFAAVEQRIEKEKRITWQELAAHLENNWAGPAGERARLMLKNIQRYGGGGAPADEYGQRITKLFTRLVTEKPTPNGFKILPGIFSWAATILLGKDVGATPNGRFARDPISHGPNPDPGFRKDGAPTAIASTVASVQPGFGNTAPLQIELDYGFSNSPENLLKVENLIKTHFDLGGTQINMNILDKERILAAHKDPTKYPDLVVRVTGFSAYFASLSPEFRQLVVDRILTGA